MSNLLPFPYPVRGGPLNERFPVFDTQHQAATLVKQYQVTGRMKRCAHIALRPTASLTGRAQAWRAECDMDSFLVDRNESLFYGCPQACLLYKPAWKAKATKRLSETHRSLWRTIAGLFEWYASLSHIAQAIIALAILALLGSPWKEVALKLIERLFEK